MKLSNLTAISPIDGRYRNKVNELEQYFSEFALIKYRIKIEIEYFIALCNIPLPQLSKLDEKQIDTLRKMYLDFSPEDAQKVKDIENTTNHDVKAVEYYLKSQFEANDLGCYKEFIHFGLTSQDVNNTAIPLSLKDALEEVYYPVINKLIETLDEKINSWKAFSMLAHTHGQPASPTNLGKEIKVYRERIEEQVKLLRQTPVSAKFGGATGNFNAHHFAYPEVNWIDFADQFVNSALGLSRSKTTTQIDHYDHLSAIFDAMKRINTILIDIDRDFWTYISMEYFKQKINKNEVGSSTMPHKVNPIDFENSEGNLGIANSLFEHISAKIPISRLQRDLTDSTVLRNIGVPLSHTLLAIKSLLKGFDKLLVNKDKLDQDLNDNWGVVTEAIQTILRKEGFANPYEMLKNISRTNNKITKENILQFIEKLNISQELKNKLKSVTPHNYTGIDLTSFLKAK
jgi:adenylosuccinate lyase